ncbi:hypothetical protein [Siphonobacter sp. SORGH_AS_1065]|uniref:hypothetical protein n=1 Tax=Siphonobacter sp. SORGH_AS_1065 TaxID=3041795 RepID=UPI00277E9F54|nr:hypothetical protein [Siphonobacter sp. SORGH_AS_1065]MDQ1089189.1 hypothetical protein [Siphonobacter sp. SORGH_AS_1065]
MNKLTLLVFLLFGLTACDFFPPHDSVTQAYGLQVWSEETEKRYFLQVHSLTEGTLTIPTDAEETTSIIFTYRNGFYYGMQEEPLALIRYKPGTKGLEKDIELLLPNIHWTYFSSWHNWIDEHTLLVGSSGAGKEFSYMIFDTEHMNVRTYGYFDVPKPEPNHYYGGVFSQVTPQALFIGYTDYQGYGSKVAASDTLYLAVFDFPSLKRQSIRKDIRSTWPGGYFINAPFWLVEEDDLYLLTQPGGRTHPHPTAPTALFRIKKGETKLDSTYLFRLADKPTQEGYLLYALGKGKALVKIVEKKEVRQYMDYLNKHLASYYLLDLHTQTKTRLDIPLDHLDFEQNVFVDGDAVYIGASTRKNESYVWKYNLKTGKLSRGLRVKGRILAINAQQ